MSKENETDNWPGAVMLLSLFVFITIWILLLVGDPDLLDAIISRVSKCGV